MRFRHYRQLDAMDCGPTCLKMVAKYYGKSYSLESLRRMANISREGVSLLGISEAAESIGFHTVAVKSTFDKLKCNDAFPFIAYWKQKHFVVVYKSTKKKVYISDPGTSNVAYTLEEFMDGWLNIRDNGYSKGIALILEPTIKFYSAEEEPANEVNIKLLVRYVLNYRKLLIQLILGMLAGSLLSLIFPFLTQAVVDVGINNRDVKFIYLILLAQLMLFVGQTAIEFIRSWILLHINSRMNISIVSDFLIKLMKLPISFFDKKMVGDLVQRIGDHQRIQNYITGPTLSTIFSFVNLVVFSIVIVTYSTKIFVVFLSGNILYALWIVILLKYRRSLDYKYFDVSSKNQSKILQLIYGMQEIKMNNCEITKRWEWERIQAKLFKVSVKRLTLSQYQQGGAYFINQGVNIYITFLSATAVIHGNITLGGMLAIQYIIGQLNSPIHQFLQFIQGTQDALISLERLNEIHKLEDEDAHTPATFSQESVDNDIFISNVSFKYPGAGNQLVLERLNLTIPQGKTTAIVGSSGSGKTTLLKLLMKHYLPVEGEIRLGFRSMRFINSASWRSQCGVVMQESFIFSDTIASNIAIGDEHPDPEKLINSVRVANIQSFIDSLPLGFNTKIGTEGIGISEGQRQRILIARAIYKNPHYIFFDEATNALDANNESVIMNNLDVFFKGRTVIIVAHRLSTVKNAHQIIVLDNGHITERGNHLSLTKEKGLYYKLVKNQLELGE